MNTGRILTAMALGGLVALGAGSANATVYRSYDGSGNNAGGEAGAELLRIVPASQAYKNDQWVGGGRPEPRAISNEVFDQPGSVPNTAGASNFLFQWGQFVDHDIDLTHTASGDTANMVAPVNDPDMAGAMIPFTRSEYSDVGGTGARQQINSITAFIDASNVYGSSAAEVNALRHDANGVLMAGGKLATSAGNLLPYDANDPGSFKAGDVRANEQIGLTSMHTLFVREHNWWADRLAAEHAGDPLWDDQMIFDEARKMVGAEMQAVTYNEFLPTLMGGQFATDLASYVYDPNVGPGIANEFSTAAYRVGHTMLPNELAVLNEDGSAVSGTEGGVPLAEAFFRPDKVATYGIDSIIRGLAATDSQEIDNMIVDGVRNMLFAMPGMTFGLDLASLNIQRGRDHGLPSYNEMRLALNLGAVSFGDGTFLVDAETLLMNAYQDDVGDIDLWVGLLSEMHFGDGMVGETVYTILLDQFARLMYGDDFWYTSYLDPAMIAEVDGTQLSDIILRNTGINWIQSNVFLTAQRDGSGGGETSVAEPATIGLFGLGLAGVLTLSRRRRA